MVAARDAALHTSRPASRTIMRKIWNTMLKGLVAILPVGLTVYLV